jgi:hypothetical protein
VYDGSGPHKAVVPVRLGRELRRSCRSCCVARRRPRADSGVAARASIAGPAGRQTATAALATTAIAGAVFQGPLTSATTSTATTSVLSDDAVDLDGPTAAVIVKIEQRQ